MTQHMVHDVLRLPISRKTKTSARFCYTKEQKRMYTIVKLQQKRMYTIVVTVVKRLNEKKIMSKMIKEGRMGVIGNICYKYDLH